MNGRFQTDPDIHFTARTSSIMNTDELFVERNYMEYSDIYKTLLTKQQQLLGRVNQLNSSVHRREEPYSADFAEQAVELENLDVLFELDKESRAELARINRALMRIKNNEYDECARSGNTIRKKRLEALPTTDLCILCAEAEEE